METAAGRATPGYDDVSVGYRMGAAKIAEMLRWCQDAGIEMATVYLLSTENLQRDPDELAALIEIITDVVEEICAPANRWSVRTVGDLSSARRGTGAPVAGGGGFHPPHRRVAAVFHVNVAVAYGGRQEIVDAVRALLNKELANGVTGRTTRRSRHRRGDLGEPLHLGPARSGSGHPDVGGAAVFGIPVVAERLFGDVVHRGALAGVPARGLPACAARLQPAAPQVWNIYDCRPWRAEATQSLRSRSRLMEWSASLRNTRVARGRVGRMFSIRLGRLIECQMSRAANTACSSVSVE